MKTAIDLVNKKFGMWTVIKRVKNIKKKVFWLCKCDCGIIRKVRGYYVEDEGELEVIGNIHETPELLNNK